jgi:hypothetical protein
MRLLPVAGSLGVLLISEIILVLWPGQPGPLQLTFPGLPTVWLQAIALARSASVIRKKKFLAVQAFPARGARLHWSQSQKESEAEKQGNQREKIQPEEKSKDRIRNKKFQ